MLNRSIWLGFFLFSCIFYASIYLIQGTTYVEDQFVVVHSSPFLMSELPHFVLFLAGFVVGFLLMHMWDFSEFPTRWKPLGIICILGINFGLLLFVSHVWGLILFVSIISLILIFALIIAFRDRGVVLSILLLFPFAFGLSYIAQNAAFPLLGFVIGSGVVIAFSLKVKLAYVLVVLTVLSGLFYFSFNRDVFFQTEMIAIHPELVAEQERLLQEEQERRIREREERQRQEAERRQREEEQRTAEARRQREAEEEEARQRQEAEEKARQEEEARLAAEAQAKREEEARLRREREERERQRIEQFYSTFANSVWKGPAWFNPERPLDGKYDKQVLLSFGPKESDGTFEGYFTAVFAPFESFSPGHHGLDIKLIPESIEEYSFEVEHRSRGRWQFVIDDDGELTFQSQGFGFSLKKQTIIEDVLRPESFWVASGTAQPPVTRDIATHVVQLEITKRDGYNVEGIITYSDQYVQNREGRVRGGVHLNGEFTLVDSDYNLWYYGLMQSNFISLLSWEQTGTSRRQLNNRRPGLTPEQARGKELDAFFERMGHTSWRGRVWVRRIDRPFLIYFDRVSSVGPLTGKLLFPLDKGYTNPISFTVSNESILEDSLVMSTSEFGDIRVDLSHNVMRAQIVGPAFRFEVREQESYDRLWQGSLWASMDGDKARDIEVVARDGRNAPWPHRIRFNVSYRNSDEGEAKTTTGYILPSGDFYLSDEDGEPMYGTQRDNQLFFWYRYPEQRYVNRRRGSESASLERVQSFVKLLEDSIWMTIGRTSGENELEYPFILLFHKDRSDEYLIGTLFNCFHDHHLGIGFRLPINEIWETFQIDVACTREECEAKFPVELSFRDTISSPHFRLDLVGTVGDWEVRFIRLPLKGNETIPTPSVWETQRTLSLVNNNSPSRIELRDLNTWYDGWSGRMLIRTKDKNGHEVQTPLTGIFVTFNGLLLANTAGNLILGILEVEEDEPVVRFCFGKASNNAVFHFAGRLPQ